MGGNKVLSLGWGVPRSHVEGGVGVGWYPCLMSQGGWPYTVRCKASWVMVIWRPSPVDRHKTENITFPQLGWRVVGKKPSIFFRKGSQ